MHAGATTGAASGPNRDCDPDMVGLSARGAGGGMAAEGAAAGYNGATKLASSCAASAWAVTGAGAST